MSLAQPMTFPQSVCTCRGSRAAMVCIELETAPVLSIVCGAIGKRSLFKPNAHTFLRDAFGRTAEISACRLSYVELMADLEESK